MHINRTYPGSFRGQATRIQNTVILMEQPQIYEEYTMYTEAKISPQTVVHKSGSKCMEGDLLEKISWNACLEETVRFVASREREEKKN